MRRTSQKHQRRLVFHLFIMSVALFALISVTRDSRVWDDNANKTLLERRTFNRAKEPPVSKTHTPGAKTSIPLFEQAEEVEALPPVDAPEASEDSLPLSQGAPAGDSEEPPLPPQEVVDEPMEVPVLSGEILVEAVRGVFEDSVKPKAEDCLHAWWMLDPAVPQRVVVGVVLGPDGLAGAWVHDHADAPLGPVTCFGAAVSEATWPAAAEQVEVRFPFLFFSEESDTAE